jgi:hypothetical protein
MSAFCTSFQLDTVEDSADGLRLRDFIHGLSGKMGVYHIWVQEDYCYEHDSYSMLGVYVGKGKALGRLLTHAKTKLPRCDPFWITFFECSNRIAKYLEQLFLDTYAFHLNENENTGTLHLYACWDNERHLLGTELHNISNRPNAPRGD